MAFAFGDPHLKLPPIKKENTVGTISEGEEPHSDRHGLHRDKHGVIRLPPIGRLHSLRPAASHRSRYSSTNESHSVTKENTPSEREKLRSQPSSIGSSKKTSLKHVEAFKEAGRDTKLNGVDFKQSLHDSHVKKTTCDGSHGSGNSSLCHLELRSVSKIPAVSSDEDAPLLCNEERTSRRGSMCSPNLKRLKKSSRLAKSSPELSYKRIKRPREEGRVEQNSTSTSASKGSCRETTHHDAGSELGLSVRDVDNTVFFSLRKPDIKWEKLQELRKEVCRNQISDHFRNPQSSPSTPICSEPGTNQKAHRGRKSLNDINDVGQLVQGKRASISPPKKQNLMVDVMGLQIKGRSCPQNERETLRSSHAARRYRAESPALHRSLCGGDRKPSVHDFHQILKILQTEEGNQLKHHKAPCSQSQGMDTSVYDLREFLMLATEASEKQKNLKSKELTASTNHLSPKKDVQSDNAIRKGSVYDLMEFLSLGSGRNSSSTSENSSRAPSPRDLLSPKEPADSKAVLSPSQQNNDPRRSSTYNLLEFLSLPRSAGANSDSEPGRQSSETVDSQEPDAGRTRSVSKEKRSLSLYDLAEFLSMTSGFPPLVRISPSERQDDGGKPGPQNEALPVHDRGSVNDLRNMLTVLQQEHDAQSAGQPSAPSTSRRGSMYNLQEILSHLEREAEESRLSITPESAPNSVEEGGLRPQSPDPTAASSGYSAANNSDSSTANDSKRSMSVYDLREFLSMYASCQQNPSNQLMFPGPYSRKCSGASQSGVSIQVTDENNQSLDYDLNDDVFQPVGLDSGEGLISKRNSFYDLREFLNLLNADDSPLRRRLSSVSSAFSEGGNSPGNDHGTDSNFGVKENDERPQLSPRQDSDGSLSLYDLNEFLSLLNTDESPLRRRLSSANDGKGTQQARSPLLPSEESPEKGLYNLEEILTALNDTFEQKRNSESTTIGQNEASRVGEISIQVPQFSSMHDRTNPLRFTVKKPSSLKSVPET